MNMQNRSLFTLAALTFFTASPSFAQNESDAGDVEVLEEVSVYGRVPNDNVRDIPQTVSVFDREAIAISPVVSVGDMIRFVPTATRNGSTMNAFGDSYVIRGFGANQTVNGLGFNRIAHARDTANVERIEVLKGPAAVLYGQMQPGAVINVVTKQALDRYQLDLGLEYGRYNDQRYTLDLTGPISENVSGRINVAYRDTESFMDSWDLQHLFVAPNIRFDLSPSTSIVIEGIYSTNDWGSFPNGTPAQGLFLPNPNGQYARSFNPDEPDIGFTTRDSVDGNIRLSHDFSDSLSLRASYTRTRNEADFIEMFVSSSQPTFVVDSRTLSRAFFVGSNAYENDNNFLVDLAGKFTTGSLTHTYVVGVNYRDFDSSRPARFTGTTQLDLFNPVYGAAPAPTPVLQDFFQNFDSTGIFLQDRISVGDNLHLLLGLRYTDSHQDTLFISASGARFVNELDEDKWSSQLGVLYDLNDTMSIYANRAESFVPQFGTSSGGSPFDSEEGVQYEIGARFDIGGLLANVAVFTNTKDNLRTSDPANPGFSAALGEVESRGFELSLNGELSPNWFFAASYGYVDTEITKNFDGIQGNVLRNTPENTFSLQTRFNIESGALSGLGLGGTIEYVDDRFGNDANSFEVPSHTRLDLGAYYAVSEKFEVDLLLNNVFDEDIYAEAFNIFRVIAEPGRTYMIRLRYRHR